MNRNEIGIIILAAGSSSRMGQPKQQLVIDGQPLLLGSVKTALETGVGKIVVVLGSNAEMNRSMLNELPVDIRLNQDWQKGMGNSLKTGIKYLKQTSPIIKAALIMVCDQPLLRSSHLLKLIRLYEDSGKPVIASAYSGTLGVPVLFDLSLFDQILQLDDSLGAKHLIQGRAESIEFSEGAMDLDTPDDVMRFLTTDQNQFR